jgi:DNA-binding HxlR family transcriptional regulator
MIVKRKNAVKAGGAVRGSKTGRPIMVLLDLLGRRWALRVLWELREEPKTARELRALCDDASPTVLNQRLKELAGSGWVSNQPGSGYGLTEEGRRLLAVFLPLHGYADGWHKRVVSDGER